MKTVPHRIIIYTKDVINITGKKERIAYNLLSRNARPTANQKAI